MLLAQEALALAPKPLQALLDGHGLASTAAERARHPLRVRVAGTGLSDAHWALLAERGAHLSLVWEAAPDPQARAWVHEAFAQGLGPARLEAWVPWGRVDRDHGPLWLAEAARWHLSLSLGEAEHWPPEAALALIPLWEAYLPQRRRVLVPQLEACLRVAGASLGLCPEPAAPPPSPSLGLEGLAAAEGATPWTDPAWQALVGHLMACLQAEQAEHLTHLAAGRASAPGRLMAMLKEQRHPATNARIAANSLALHLLGASASLPEAAQALVARGGAPDEAGALAWLQGLWQGLQAEQGRNNLYFHVTYRCQLNCPHCYSSSGGGAVNAGHDELPPEALWRLLEEGHAEGFRQAVITGGEPWFHRQRPELMRVLRQAKAQLKPLLVVLRTNLVATLSPADLAELAASVDKLVVSIDGDELRHDAIRGKGSFARTLKNLQAYQAAHAHEAGAAELMLSAALSYRDIHGAQGAAVRALAASLGVKELRLNELKPIGRGGEGDGAVDMHAAYPEHFPVEGLRQMKPTKNCGLGTSLYLDPSGEAYPCNFFHGPKHRLGNVLQQGLSGVLASQGFRSLAGRDVDSNRKCSSCGIRYLCGLALCRVHGGQPAFDDPDAPVHCEGTPHRQGIEQQVALAQRYLHAIAPKA